MSTTKDAQVDDGNVLTLIGCGSAKQDEPAPASELYTSSYFAKKRTWGRAWGDIVILSAKYGIVQPDREIPPYDQTLKDYSDDEAAAWADDVLADLPHEYDAYVVLAGSDYVEPIRDGLEAVDGEVYFPFDATSGIGDQIGWLNDETTMPPKVSSLGDAMPNNDDTVGDEDTEETQ